MKKFFLVAMAILSLAPLALLSGCTKDDGTVYNLTYNNFFPATSLNSVLAEQWIQEIQDRSNGKVKIAYYPAGQLAAANKTYDGVVQGICDIGMSVLAYSPGVFPTSELIDYPHAYPNGYVATMVANDYYNQFKPAEFDNVHPLYFHAPGPYVVFTTKTPIRTMEDLKGKVIRATGVGTKIVQALGGQGYGGTQGETYELLSKGVVDGNFSTLESLKSYKQADVVKYITNSQAVGNTSMMFVVMNKEKWASLPANIQKIFTDVSKDFIKNHAEVWTYYDQSGIDYFNSLGDGREIITLSKAEQDKWVAAAVKPLIDAYTTDKTAKGLPAADYEKYINERVQYWSTRVPSAETIKNYVETEVTNWTPPAK
ncbi:MAG: TRAP transporter substrate-binding protein [Dehalococcoidales bacterium]|nr:TRAP transporter substrate-binding protein [Dehalococcoidales bacterium]